MKTILEHLKECEAKLVAWLEETRKHIAIASETPKTDTSGQDTTAGKGGDNPPTGPGIPS